MNEIQHYVTGQGDDSLAALAGIYRTSASAISNATFGGTGASLIYPWLRDHGGRQRAADPNVPTGHNWSFAPGMVVNVPTSNNSISPPLTTANPPAIPGGPMVTIIYADTAEIGDTGAPSAGREYQNDAGESVPEPDSSVSNTAGGVDVGTSTSSLGGGMWTWLGIAVGAYFMFPEWFGGGKKVKPKRRRKSTRRRKKSTRKRRRR